MGVRATLAGITLTAGDKTQAATVGIDAAGLLAEAQLKCSEAIQQLNVLITDVLTPASDASNITALNAQITALS
jgi:hypothetical protein